MELLKIAIMLAATFLLALPTYGNIGQTKKQNKAKYGNTVHREVSDAGYEILQYENGDFTIVCIYDKKGVCRMEVYFSSHISIDQANKILGVTLPQYSTYDLDIIKDTFDNYIVSTNDKKYAASLDRQMNRFVIFDVGFQDKYTKENKESKIGVIK